MLLWETHMCYSEMGSCYSGYVTLLLEVGGVFIFCVEALHWKTITFFWKGKNFMMLLWEMHMCYSLMRSPSLGYVKVLFKVRGEFIISLEVLLCKILKFFWKGKNFINSFVRNTNVLLWNGKTYFMNMSKFCSKLEQCSFSL